MRTEIVDLLREMRLLLPQELQLKLYHTGKMVSSLVPGINTPRTSVENTLGVHGAKVE